jgi:hypothetical protein
MSAALIAQLIAQYGLPLVVGLVERWSKEDPTNPTATDWLQFLKSPTLTQSYDEFMRNKPSTN